MTDPDLAALIARAAMGESEAFTELVREHHAQVYRWALVAADDPDDAEDVAQQTWIKVYRRLKEYRGSAKFTTWLYRIVFNTAVEGHRTRERRGALLGLAGQRDQVASHVEPDTGDCKRLMDVVRGYLAGLPLRQRTVFALADLEGISAGEIAERLEMTEVTVRTNLFKARRAIRERLLREQAKFIEEVRS